MEAISIKTVLQEVFQDIGGSRQKREEAIVQAWGRVVGTNAAGHTRLMNIKHSCLIVGVDSAPWLYLLSLYKHQILKKMAAVSPEFRQEQINQIQLKTIGVQQRG